MLGCFILFPILSVMRPQSGPSETCNPNGLPIKLLSWPVKAKARLIHTNWAKSIYMITRKETLPKCVIFHNNHQQPLLNTRLGIEKTFFWELIEISFSFLSAKTSFSIGETLFLEPVQISISFLSVKTSFRTVETLFWEPVRKFPSLYWPIISFIINDREE